MIVFFVCFFLLSFNKIPKYGWLCQISGNTSYFIKSRLWRTGVCTAKLVSPEFVVFCPEFRLKYLMKSNVFSYQNFQKNWKFWWKNNVFSYQNFRKNWKFKKKLENRLKNTLEKVCRFVRMESGIHSWNWSVRLRTVLQAE